MCRVFYMAKKINEDKLSKILEYLEKEAGGDGNGIGGFINKKPFVEKDIKNTTDSFAQEMIDHSWDNGVLFHTRRASVGSVNDNNCHPFICNNTITVHNGHIEGSGLMKLMMLENIDKYAKDGWSFERLSNSTDSEIMSYFINKYGFDIVPLLNPGTVMTMYPDRVEIYVGYCLEAINTDGVWVYASSFSPAMGMASKHWFSFYKGSGGKITPDGSCILTSGGCYDAKKEYIEQQKMLKSIEVK